MNWDFRCDLCGKVFDERGCTVWSKVTGYTKPRSGGGTNHIACMEVLPERRCDLCMTKILSGDHPGQVNLFG